VTEKVDASFSMLVMSVASSAAMALGLTPNPQSNEIETDKDMARFNIDLLMVLKDKTKNNLSKEETDLLDHLLKDLQLKFVQFK
jgi:Domain of unknown function (DUF1844)